MVLILESFYTTPNWEVKSILLNGILVRHEIVQSDTKFNREVQVVLAWPGHASENARAGWRAE